MSAAAIGTRSDSAIALTDERIDAIAALGYTRREAAFLNLVGQHGGYFLRRHFLSFTGQQAGQAVVDFTRLLVPAAMQRSRPSAAARTCTTWPRAPFIAMRTTWGNAIVAVIRRTRSSLG